METYRLGLFSLARDSSAGVRRAVCGGLVQLLHLQPEALAPQMRDIIEYMLESSQVGCVVLVLLPVVPEAASAAAVSTAGPGVYFSTSALMQQQRPVRHAP